MKKTSARHIRRLVPLLILAASGLALVGPAMPEGILTDRAALDALSPDETTAGLARAALRAAGPGGLDVLMRVHAGEIRRMREGLESGRPVSPAWLRLRTALDTVAKQRDAAWSGVYWFTDLKEAEKAASAAGRPILSLRLLGNLDEELSCANSRYFRTVLYANAAISDRLRRGWILHWESVRPVPRITVNFGDGRRIETTITGNSLHYVLTSRGEVVDALPGLWTPDAFLALLETAGATATKVDGLPLATRGEALRTFHESSRKGAAFTSVRVGTTLDENSRELMRVKMGGVGRPAFATTVRNFEQSLAQEDQMNGGLRRTILGWLAQTPAGSNALGALTERIYEQVFLTPRQDPWLGLVPANTYGAVEGNGLVDSAGAKGPRPLTTNAVSAIDAGRLTMSKVAREAPMLATLARPGFGRDLGAMIARGNPTGSR